MIEYTLYTEEEKEAMKSLMNAPEIAYLFNGEWYWLTYEDAEKLGIDLDKRKLTIRDRLSQKVRDWHSRMATWHGRRSIGLM